MKRLPSMFLYVLAINLCLTQAELVYQVDFEDGSRSANIGRVSLEIQGTSITNEENPDKSGRNTSDRCGYSQVPSSGRRAEFSSQRVETNEKTYVYKWSYFIPDNFFSGSISWMLISQWKTWPCEDNCGGGSHSSEVCYSCGIFNEIGLSSSNFSFAWRAEPDCRRFSTDVIQGEWVDFQQEIYWTNTSNGYYKLWKNGELVSEDENIVTLFDNFDEGRCDIYWAVGVYTSWSGNQGLYYDNLEIWDTSGVDGIIGEDRPTIVFGEEKSMVSPWDKSYQLQFRPDLVWKESMQHLTDVSGRRAGVPNAKNKNFRLPAGIYVQQKNIDGNNEKARKESEEQKN
ncbi:heparin lyase I family protein [Fibrobacterota bacterium]